MSTEYTDRPPADAPHHARAAWEWFEGEHPSCALRRITLRPHPRRWSAVLVKTCGQTRYDAVRVEAGGLAL